MGYEHYLLEVMEQECQVRQQRRIERLLYESHLPVEKSLAHLELDRLPRKVVNQVQTLLTGHSSLDGKMCWSSAILAAVKPIW